MATSHGNGHSKGFLPLLILGAIGIVYGDIGTSVLYALKEGFKELERVPTQADVLGLLSLIFWALTLVVTVKYVFNVLNAENSRGEGGIPALLGSLHKKIGFGFILLGIFGVGLLLGEGMITPAISVLSAFEGLKVVNPAISQGTIQVYTLGVLFVLFSVQRWGTGLIGFLFGPIMLVWFLVIGLLGINGIRENPAVLAAVWPGHAYSFMMANRELSAKILGAVVLVVTGGEALFADLAHYGKKAIKISWLCLVMPALLLNYFGQGAHILGHPESLDNPFFGLVPESQREHMVYLAVAATIIASQALISGAFSLTKQLSIDLHNMPAFEIKSTSKKNPGQIYVPIVNTIVGIGAIALVVFFKESTNLAAAYGIAVTGTMTVTTILFFLVQRRLWHRAFWKAGLLTLLFLSVDLTFFSSNIHKISAGGWIPLTSGTILALGMQFYFMHNKGIRRWKKQELVPVSLDRSKDIAVICADEYIHQGTALTVAEAQQTLCLPFLVIHAVVDEDRREPVKRYLGDLGVGDDSLVLLDAPSGDWVRPTADYIRQLRDSVEGRRVWVMVSQTLATGPFKGTHKASSTALETALSSDDGITFVKSNFKFRRNGRH